MQFVLVIMKEKEPEEENKEKNMFWFHPFLKENFYFLVLLVSRIKIHCFKKKKNLRAIW